MRATAMVITSLVWLASASAGYADRLVTRDGGTVETQGPWTVKGRLVVFKLPNGNLSSMRLDDVDLDKSREATEEATRAAAEPAEKTEKAEPVLVLTNKDVPRAAAPPPPAEGGEGEGQGEGGAQGASGERPPLTSNGPVECISWSPSRNLRGLEIRGTLRNTRGDPASQIRVTVRLYDGETGGLLDERQADTVSQELRPDGTTSFLVSFPGLDQTNVKTQIHVDSVSQPTVRE